MTVQEIISELQQRGVEILPEGPHLRYRAPKGVMTPELRSVILEPQERIAGLSVPPASK